MEPIKIPAHERKTGPHTTVRIAAHERRIDVKGAAAARHSAESYARSVVKRWPGLTEEKRSEIRAILTPLLTESR